MARRRRLAGLLVLAVSLLTAAPTGAGEPRDVTMLDNRYAPNLMTVGQGQQVELTNFGQEDHDAVDDTGLDLFDTGLLSPPESATIGPLPGAGTYGYVCTFHPEMTGRFDVPIRVSDREVPTGAEVTVHWATTRAPAGLVFDVQRRRPGADRFEPWRTGVGTPATRWWPATPGRWVLRARVRDAEGGAASAWSPLRAVRVG
ncbi:MAG TPA: hypothetical protein VD926_11705 [Acidimicrobiales bacterium]|nr:hypothetical protein [Acidimicrobiales bacterium]